MSAFRSNECIDDLKAEHLKQDKRWADIIDESDAEDSVQFGDSEDDTSASEHGPNLKDAVKSCTSRKQGKSWNVTGTPDEWQTAGKKTSKQTFGVTVHKTMPTEASTEREGGDGKRGDRRNARRRAAKARREAQAEKVATPVAPKPCVQQRENQASVAPRRRNHGGPVQLASKSHEIIECPRSRQARNSKQTAVNMDRSRLDW